MKKFIITVDTEGDNLWDNLCGSKTSTENSLFIPRFQELSEKYGFFPVYLTNYEMANDPRFTVYAANKARTGKCEIGLHLHAWDTPPFFPISNKYGGNPYITEYPDDIVEQKIATVLDKLRATFEQKIVSHRAGRWATNQNYFDCLAKQGIRVDCSVTPEVDLSSIPGCSAPGGNNYQKAPKGIYKIHPQILEVPMSTRRIRCLSKGSIKHRIKCLLYGEIFWLRPIKKSFEDLVLLTETIEKEPNNEYVEFMIHSSELMPGGSPYFKDAESVEQLYAVTEKYFSYMVQKGYHGAMLKDFVH